MMNQSNKHQASRFYSIDQLAQLERAIGPDKLKVWIRAEASLQSISMIDYRARKDEEAAARRDAVPLAAFQHLQAVSSRPQSQHGFDRPIMPGRIKCSGPTIPYRDTLRTTLDSRPVSSIKSRGSNKQTSHRRLEKSRLRAKDLLSVFKTLWDVKRRRKLFLGDQDIGPSPFMHLSEQGLRQAADRLRTDIQALRYRSPPPMGPARMEARAASMMMFSLKRTRDDDDAGINNKIPPVDIANLLEWKRMVAMKLAVINRTGISRPLYEPEPVVDPALEATLRTPGYMLNGAHAVMPIEEAILHHGTPKGKEILKKRIDDRDAWRLQNNQIFAHVQIACEGNMEISQFINARVEATPLALRSRMNGFQLLEDICIQFHQDTPASINLRTGAFHQSKIRSDETAYNFTVRLEKEARYLLSAGVVLDVSQVCLQITHQALLVCERYKQFGVTIFLRTGIDAALTWDRVKDIIRGWDINNSSAKANTDRHSSSSSDTRMRIRSHVGGTERSRVRGRKFYRRNGQLHEARKSASPPANERSYYTGAMSNQASKKPRVDDRRPQKSNQRKFAKSKSNSVYVPRDFKCFGCGGPHLKRDCPQSRFGKSSANYLGRSTASSALDLTAEDDGDDKPHANVFELSSEQSLLSKRKLEEFGDLFASSDEDDDDEIAAITSSSSQFSCLSSGPDYSPVAPSFSPTVPLYTIDSCPPAAEVSRFDITKLNRRHIGLTKDYLERIRCSQREARITALRVEKNRIYTREFHTRALEAISRRFEEVYLEQFNSFELNSDDEAHLLLYQLYRQAGEDLGLGFEEIEGAIALAKENSHYVPGHSTRVFPIVRSDVGSSVEFLRSLYRDCQTLQSADWVSNDSDCYETTDPEVFAQVLARFHTIGLRTGMKQSRLFQVLNRFKAASLEERKLLWSTYDHTACGYHLDPPPSIFNLPENEIASNAFDMARETDIILSERHTLLMPEVDVNLACIRAKGLTEYREALLNLVCVDVFCPQTVIDFRSELDKSYYLNEWDTIYADHMDRLATAVNCAYSRGYNNKFCTNCVHGVTGPFCQFIRMKAEGNPTVLSCFQDGDSLMSASSAKATECTVRLRCDAAPTAASTYMVDGSSLPPRKRMVDSSDEVLPLQMHMVDGDTLPPRKRMVDLSGITYTNQIVYSNFNTSLHQGPDSALMMQTSSSSSKVKTGNKKLPPATAIFDSGCSTTTFNDQSFFDLVEKINRQIQTADSTISVSHAGPVPPFYEAFYVPGLHTNLISLSDLDDLGVVTVIEGGKLTGYYEGKAIYSVDKKHSLWKVSVDKLLGCLREIIGTRATEHWKKQRTGNTHFSLTENSLEKTEEFLSLWHKRLFHRNIQDLCKALIQQRILVGDVSGYRIQYRSTSSEKICESCVKSKSHAFPKPAASISARPGTSIPARTVKSTYGGQLRSSRPVTVAPTVVPTVAPTKPTASVPADNSIRIESYGRTITNPHGFKAGLVSTDLTGPYSVKTLKGNYVGNQVFLELDSKYAYIYFYRNKSDALDNLKSLVNFEFKRQRLSMTDYHSDGAGELCGVEVRKFLAQIGCRSTWITADVPQENSFSERHFRTESEQTQASMLYARYLPKSLWNFAKEAFTHVYNRFPTNTAKGWMSPYEFKRGVAPDVSYFRVWGSKCFANIALSHRRKDWAPKAQVGYLVGYSEFQSDAYKIWIPETNRITVSRNVIFDEVIPQGDVDFTKDSYWREVRQFSKRVTAKKRNVEDFYYLVELVFYDPDLDKECIVKEIRAQGGHIVAVYACLKDGIETGEEGRMHVADVEKLLGVYLSEDYGDDVEGESSVKALQILESSAPPITPAQVATVVELNSLLCPERRNSHVKENETLDEDSSPTAAIESLGSAEREMLSSSRSSSVGRPDLQYAIRTHILHGSDEPPSIRAETSVSSVVEVPHVKGALYTFANEYVASNDPVTVKH